VPASRRLASLLLLASLAACGTTVPLQSQRTEVPGGIGGAGLSGDGSTSGSAAPGTSGSLAAGGATGGISGSTGSGTSGGASSGTSGGTGDFGSTGVSLKPGAPISVGVAAPNYAAIAVALGANPDATDPFIGYKKMFAKINSAGGYSGHKVNAIYYNADGAAASADSEASKACAYFTQDHHVDIVISDQYYVEGFLSCLQRKNIAVLETTRWAYDKQLMAQHPNWFPLDGMAEDRYIAALLEVESQVGVLTSKDHVGVLMPDCAGERRVYSTTIQPLAKKIGFTVEQATTACAGGASDIAQASNQIQAAVLKFRSDGVTKVMAMTGAEGFYLILFTRNASQQKWYPGYMLSSNAFPFSNTDTSSPVSFAADSFPHMTGVGYIPILDTGDRGFKPFNAAQGAVQAQCRKYDPTLLGWSSDSGKRRWEKAYFFYAGCDVVTMLGRIVATTGAHLALPAVIQAYTQILPTAAGAAVAGGRYSAPGGRRDGVGQVAPFAWNTGCACFANTGAFRAADF
jgi:hypothetical protein